MARIPFLRPRRKTDKIRLSAFIELLATEFSKGMKAAKEAGALIEITDAELVAKVMIWNTSNKKNEQEIWVDFDADPAKMSTLRLPLRPTMPKEDDNE